MWICGLARALLNSLSVSGNIFFGNLRFSFVQGVACLPKFKICRVWILMDVIRPKLPVFSLPEASSRLALLQRSICTASTTDAWCTTRGTNAMAMATTGLRATCNASTTAGSWTETLAEQVNWGECAVEWAFAFKTVGENYVLLNERCWVGGYQLLEGCWNFSYELYGFLMLIFWKEQNEWFNKRDNLADSDGMNWCNLMAWRSR